MDKNTGIGIVLLVLLWGLLMWYNQSEQQKIVEQQKEQAEAAAAADTGRLIQPDTIIQAVTEIMAEQTARPSGLSSEELGVYAPFAAGEEQLFSIENESCIYTFSNKGGALKSVILKGYVTHDKQPLVLFDAGEDNLGVGFFTAEAKAPINTAQLFFSASATSDNVKLGADDQPFQLVFTVDPGNGQVYEHRYTIPAKGNTIDYTIAMPGMHASIPRNINYITLNWQQVMPSQEGNINDERMYSNVYYRASNNDVESLSQRKDEEKRLASKIQWVSFKQKFFNATLIAEGLFESGTRISARKDSKDEIVKEVSAEFVIPYSGAEDFAFPMQFYFGPNKYNDLKAMKIDLDKVIPLGWGIFGWVNKFLIIPIFNFLGSFISNYGLNIFILTIIIKLITGPFTYKSYLSMIKMKVLRPEIDELKEKYGKEQQKFAAKQMELFRKAGVNPMGGCLPLLLQMPILLAMYRFFPSSIELRQEAFLWAKDLSHYDSILTLPFTIPAYGSHVSLFAILMAVSSFAYSKMNQAAQPSTSSQDALAMQMKMFIYIMPFMLLFIFNSTSAALSYYYFLFNLTSIAQQLLMSKFLIDEDKIHAQIQENKAKPMKQSKFQAKLEQMMKAQQEAQKNQQQQRGQGKKK